MSTIAQNAAHFAVDNWGRELTNGQRAVMWKRYYDSVYAALMLYQGMTETPRREPSFSEN